MRRQLARMMVEHSRARQRFLHAKMELGIQIGDAEMQLTVLEAESWDREQKRRCKSKEVHAARRQAHTHAPSLLAQRLSCGSFVDIGQYNTHPSLASFSSRISKVQKRIELGAIPTKTLSCCLYESGRCNYRIHGSNTQISYSMTTDSSHKPCITRQDTRSSYRYGIKGFRACGMPGGVRGL